MKQPAKQCVYSILVSVDLVTDTVSPMDRFCVGDEVCSDYDD